MRVFKRIGVFLLVNLLVIATLGLLMNILGIGYYVTPYGINYFDLMAFSLLWGMGGAFISLFLSKRIAKWMMKVKIVDLAKTQDPAVRAVVERVHHFARAAGLTKMPEVGIYESPEMNAFATGATRNNCLVAVSTGLMQRMDERSLDGVLAHEVAHIANGDMVTMTLVQGIINAIVIFLARVIAYAISTFLRRGEGSQSVGGGMGHFFLIMALEIGLSFFGMIVVTWFSRKREFRADAGGARYAGRDSMISALQSLQKNVAIVDARTNKPALNAMKISNNSKRGLASLFATHPPLTERIRRLQMGTPIA